VTSPETRRAPGERPGGVERNHRPKRLLGEEDSPGWPVVTVDGLDMGRAAAQLLDELGRDRSAELVVALLRRGWHRQNAFDALERALGLAP
jgi:hypothetical protein